MTETIGIYDLDTGRIRRVSIIKFDEMLDNLKKQIRKTIEKLEKIDNKARLKDFSINIGFKSGTLMVSSNGGIRLNYELIRIEEY